MVTSLLIITKEMCRTYYRSSLLVPGYYFPGYIRGCLQITLLMFSDIKGGGVRACDANEVASNQNVGHDDNKINVL